MPNDAHRLRHVVQHSLSEKMIINTTTVNGSKIDKLSTAFVLLSNWTMHAKQMSVLGLNIFVALAVCTSGCDGSSSATTTLNESTESLGSSSVESNGNVIGDWLGNVGTDLIQVQLSSGYQFSLDVPEDGVSPTVQVSSQTLYYTTADCSGPAYVANNLYAGSVFVGYGEVDTSSLFYSPALSTFSQLPAMSQRGTFEGLMGTISFSSAPASGTYALNFGGNFTANINWNDSAAQIQAKIMAGIPEIVASTVWMANPSFIEISYQTAQGNDDDAITITENSLENSSSASISATVSAEYTAPGTCSPVGLVANGAAGALNMALMPALPNNSSVTGLSRMFFPQPITIN